jgi:hypothetical protein
MMNTKPIDERLNLRCRSADRVSLLESGARSLVERGNVGKRLSPTPCTPAGEALQAGSFDLVSKYTGGILKKVKYIGIGK